jgi:hypothetical protein
MNQVVWRDLRVEMARLRGSREDYREGAFQRDGWMDRAEN